MLDTAQHAHRAAARSSRLGRGAAGAADLPGRPDETDGSASGEARRRSVRVKPLRPMRLPGQGQEKPDEGATVTAAGFAQSGQEIRAVALWAKNQARRLAAARPEGQPHRPLVAVLLRSKTHMDEYVSALEDEGLDVARWSALTACSTGPKCASWRCSPVWPTIPPCRR